MRPSSSITRYFCRLGVLALAAVLGCDLSGQPKPEDRYVRPQEIKDSAILFEKNCAGCHGKDGKLGPAPPLNDKLFLGLVSSEDIEMIIAEGRQGTPMPAFAVAQGGEMTAEQVHILAEGIKTQWGPSAAVPPTTPPYFLEPGKPGNKDAGLNVFARACASCHGEHGEGGRAGAIHQPDFLALISDQALRRIIITGRPDLGMPDYGDPKGRPEGFKALTTQEVADLAAMLASWRTNGSGSKKGR